MVLIFGGAYQGKSAYAMKRFGNSKIIHEFDYWILELVKRDADIEEEVRQFIAANPDAVVVCNDISSGVVPVDPLMRKWREAVGRALAALSQQSDEVVRLFCGIPTRLK